MTDWWEEVKIDAASEQEEEDIKRVSKKVSK